MFSRWVILFKEAVRATMAAKTRAALSAVCIGLGIASVTIVTALGSAAISKATEMMELMGTDAVMIFSGGKKKMAAGGRELTLTQDDLEGLRENFPDAYLVAPLRARFGLPVSYQNSRMATELDAINTSVQHEWNWPIAIGRDFNEDDRLYSTNSCIIGSYVHETLFGDMDPVGEQIQVGKFMCEVIGVTQKKSLGSFDNEMNTFVMIPDTTFTKRYGWFKTRFMIIRMRFLDVKSIDKQMESVAEYLRHSHSLEDGQEDDFQILTPSTMNAMFMAVLGAMGAFLGVITLVIVVVGGFVTANMFLLATQTRIKEIGIRRAFGATGDDIFRQFIVEFIVIIFLGMVTGLVLGTVASYVITSLGFIEVRITPVVFLVTAAASMMIALTFGILPARSASKINPIEAIRTL